jgi:hypothetical protein
MKKYILPAAFLMIAGIAGAQTTAKTTTHKPVAKTHKTTTAGKSATTTSVSSTTPTTSESTKATAPIKRKHHKKKKSVPAGK